MPAHIVQIGKTRFICGLFWQSLSRPRDFWKEAAQLATKIDADMMVLRKDHAMAQAGYVHSKERLRIALGNALSNVCMSGDGCSHCNGRGTIGRTVVAEVIIPDAEFYERVRAGNKIAALEYWRTELGGRSIVEHAIEKVAAGLIDPAVAEKTVGLLAVAAPAAPAAPAVKRRRSPAKA